VEDGPVELTNEHSRDASGPKDAFMSAKDIALQRRSRRRKVRARQGSRPVQRGLMLAAAAGAVFVMLVASVVGGIAMLGLQQYRDVAETVGPAEDVVAGYSQGGARVLDRNGILLYEFVDEFLGLRRPVPLSSVSEAAIHATIAVEDPDFWTNTGINVRGTVRAGVENFAPFLVGGTTFLEGTGGSSITQQLARNVYMSREEREDRSIERKLREMVIARELTERYSKEQLLEWYLNLLPYGGIYAGIEAASQGYFGKPAGELNLAEAALLAGIPQSPSGYFPYASENFNAATGDLAMGGRAKARQAAVLDLMVAAGNITPAQAAAAHAEPLRFREARFDIEAPHFVLGRIADEIAARFGERALYEDGLEVVTSLDLGLQRIAEEIVDRNVREFGEQANLHNGAYIALDPHTGQILVYVGSRDYFDLAIEGNNDNIVARNSPGSTLKPFTFITAFTQGWGTGTGILDTPLTIPDGVGGEFTPRNPGTGFQGPVTAAVALGNSFNITAIKTMIASGVPETIEMYKRFGYTTLDNPAGYGPALTTGGGEITLLDQAIAYSVLATGGIMRGQEAIATRNLDPGERTLEPVALLRVTAPDGEVLYEFNQPDEQRVVGEEYAYLVTSILSDPQNTCITYSACGALGLASGYPSAAKTGTSEPFETQGLIGETWTMGYTPHLVSGIWAGNADNDPIRGISSTTVSLRAWKEFTEAAIEYLDLPRAEFERPSGVVERQVCWPSGLLVTSACPASNQYMSLYAAEVLPAQRSDAPHMYDSWWQNRSIDRRTGLIANAQTPDSARSDTRLLVLPVDEIQAWSGFRAWAANHGVGAVLGTVPGGSQGPLVAEIRSPTSGQGVSGHLTIAGRAASDGFIGYTVEWGRGPDPEVWNTLVSSARPVTGGTLARWDTQALADGDYTLRLILQDADLGSRRFTIPVRVENASLAPARAGITTPATGGEVAGTVAITGTATARSFLAYHIEVAEGGSSAWHSLAIGTSAVESGVLAMWDTTGVRHGQWTIRVTVAGESGATAVHQVQVLVRSNSD
jgi:membrane peptidoglycan carboxypeptidase